MSADNETKSDETKYKKIINKIFFDRHKEGAVSIEFTRDDIIDAANQLSISIPKNIGDVVYSVRYRNSMPRDVKGIAPKGMEWVIEGAGDAKYLFSLYTKANIVPRTDMQAIQIPDNTPDVIYIHRMTDEQSLLCKIRYNRLIDLFLGNVAYSMQNHLRTKVEGIGQIEIDELYIGVNKRGQQFIIPVEAKVGKDKIGVVQLKQDIAFCKERFPSLICVPIAIQRIGNESDNTVCLFQLAINEKERRVEVVEEKHFVLVSKDEFDEDALIERNMAGL